MMMRDKRQNEMKHDRCEGPEGQAASTKSERITVERTMTNLEFQKMELRNACEFRKLEIANDRGSCTRSLACNVNTT